jgi:hypothetical protein
MIRYYPYFINSFLIAVECYIFIKSIHFAVMLHLAQTVICSSRWIIVCKFVSLNVIFTLFLWHWRDICEEVAVPCNSVEHQGISQGTCHLQTE